MTNKIKRNDFYLFTIILPILFYPDSPTFYGYINGPIGFVILSFLVMFMMAFNCRMANAQVHFGRFIIAAIVYFLIHPLFVPFDLFNVRMVLTLLVIYFLSKIDTRHISALLWHLSKFFVIVFMVSVFFKAAVYFEFIDLVSWRVDLLSFVNDNNPAKNRFHYGEHGFDYFMPFYLTVWQEAAHGYDILYGLGPFKWIRFPFIFTESSFVAKYLVPLLLIQPFFFDKKMSERIFHMSIMLVMVLWSFSHTALVAIFFLAPLFYTYNRLSVFMFRGNERMSTAVLLLLVIITSFLMVIFSAEWINLLGGGKIEQLNFYSYNIGSLQFMTLFGSQIEDTINYGWLATLKRLGLVGAMLFITIYSYSIYRSFTLNKAVYVIPLLIATIINFKFTEPISIFYVLICIFTFGIESNKMRTQRQ